MARLKEQYVNEIAPALNKKFGYKSVMQIPKLDKVIINVAAGEAKENAKVIDAIVADLGLITGQKAIVCKARKSVANFKLREGMPIGAKVTLRGERMYEFVDRRQLLRRPRQLRLRPEGADHLPRDRLRQGRCDPRHGHLLRHHRQDRRGGQGAAEGSGRSVRKLREGTVNG